jgi:hypothetical protein
LTLTIYIYTCVPCEINAHRAERVRMLVCQNAITWKLLNRDSRYLILAAALHFWRYFHSYSYIWIQALLCM